MRTRRPDVLVAYIDGGSRGNPGSAGFGVHVEDEDGRVVHEFGEPLGVATNNVAEYHGLLAALAWAGERGERRLRVRSDSELLVRQMRGEYRVKNPGLQLLYARARSLVDRFDSVVFEHVPRSMNRDADRLANLAMDSAAAGADRRAAGAWPGPTDTGASDRNDPAARPERDGASRRKPEFHVPSRQNSLPFDDHLPDNSPHSPEPSRPTRRTRRS